jgi:S-formylglutathione hydrolase FrmB
MRIMGRYGRAITAALAMSMTTPTVLAQVPGLTLISETTLETNPRIHILTFDTDVLGGGGADNPDLVKAVVLLPANYDPGRTDPYPVVYHFHGGVGSASTALAETFATEMATTGVEAIVVLPDGGAAGYYKNWFNNGALGKPE